MNEHDGNVATVKVLIAWLGAVTGSMTLSSAVLIATLVYTLLQIFLTYRKIRRDFLDTRK